MKPCALAISPHLDDAAFSAGGALAHLARAGWRVVIATVFTASVADPRGFALACQLDKGLPADVDYMALRRAEDAAAARHLGAIARWLPFEEAPHRGYHDARALFGGLHDDDTIVAALAPALKALIEHEQPEIVFAPQAIGGHVDHVAVVHALDALGDRPTLWWRDYPYTDREASPPEPFPRFAAMPEVAVAFDSEAGAAKTEAAAAYASQLGFQFGSETALRERLAEAGAAERFRTTPAMHPLVAGLVGAAVPPAD